MVEVICLYNRSLPVNPKTRSVWHVQAAKGKLIPISVGRRLVAEILHHAKKVPSLPLGGIAGYLRWSRRDAEVPMPLHGSPYS